MTWKDPSDKLSIQASVKNKYEQQIIDLAENIGQLDESGSWLIDDRFLVGLVPDQIINAMALVVSHFEDGENIFSAMTTVEKALVSHQVHLIIEINALAAAADSHLGEADESLLDSAGGA